MLKSTVLAHYGTQAAVAAALDISRAAVNKWGEVVPLEQARSLEIITGGAVRVDEALYAQIARAHSMSAA